MKEMIERKNELLKDGSDRLCKIKEIAEGLEGVNYAMDHKMLVQFCKLAGYKLRFLSYLWVDMIDESNICLPEAEEGEDDAEA